MTIVEIVEQVRRDMGSKFPLMEFGEKLERALVAANAHEVSR